MRTKAKRKLVPNEVLNEALLRQSYGVPITRIIADYNLDISRPLFVKLLDCYQLSQTTQLTEEERNSSIIYKSLFPDWLDSDNMQVQEQPEGWAYEGRFPWGKWVYDENN